jgi:uncharacterized protein DUF4124
MMKKIVMLFSLFLFALPAFGTTYTWVDDQGTVNFSDDLGSIPKKFRKKAKVVRGEDAEQPSEKEQEPKEKVKDTVQQGTLGGEPKGTAPATGQEKKNAEFGGKAGSAWKMEFATVNADLKAAEEQLVQLRGRLANTGSMSRTEYLSIQATIRNAESRVLDLRKKRDDLAADADRAQVPGEFR